MTGLLNVDTVRSEGNASVIMVKRPKHPAHADVNQLAKSVVDAATSERDDPPETAAQKRGRLGGPKGGKSRAEKLTAERRAEIARKAARERWQKKRPQKESADHT